MNIRKVMLVDSSRYYPSNPLFAEALAELAAERGYDWQFIDDAPFFSSLDWSRAAKAVYRLTRRPLGFRSFNQALIMQAREFRPDVTIIVKGAHVSPETLMRIRGYGSCLVNFATDDPFNSANSTRELVAGIPIYDIYACTKRAIMPDVIAAGAQQVIYVKFGYKPQVHFPEMPTNEEERRRFSADVTFIGGCDSDRIPFLETLKRCLPGARLRLYGVYWDRVPSLREHWCGFAFGRDFRLAVGSSAVVLNLVRRANRDDHVMRTFEIPACGGFMMCERTTEHEALFQDGREAIFFDSAEDMVSRIEHFIQRPSRRGRIAELGCSTVRSGGNSYRHRLVELLDAVMHAG